MSDRLTADRDELATLIYTHVPSVQHEGWALKVADALLSAGWRRSGAGEPVSASGSRSSGPSEYDVDSVLRGAAVEAARETLYDAKRSCEGAQHDLRPSHHRVTADQEFAHALGALEDILAHELLDLVAIVLDESRSRAGEAVPADSRSPGAPREWRTDPNVRARIGGLVSFVNAAITAARYGGKPGGVHDGDFFDLCAAVASSGAPAPTPNGGVSE